MTSLRTLGSSDLEVFPLSLGGNVFGWTADEAQSFAVLDAYVAAGGNFVDTADAYSAWVPGNKGGESETVIGKWLAARGNRSDVVIATKVGAHPDFKGLSADTIKSAAEESLRRPAPTTSISTTRTSTTRPCRSRRSSPPSTSW